MILADTMAILFVFIGVLLAFNGIWLFNRAIWPELVEETIYVFQHGVIKSFLLGLLVLGLLVLLVGILSGKGKGPAEFAILIVISAYFLFANIAVAGLAAIIGERLGFSKGSTWKATLFGGIVLEFAFVFPLMGWLLIFPLATITGGGATLRSLWRLFRARRQDFSGASAGASAGTIIGKKRSKPDESVASDSVTQSSQG
ncbi:MAG: hypothetical protein K8F91_17750 [Candidatus Obscuribacterales bacterium]|nr:hypothetical protein [Candidatus Obscuribacterales bacterium]